MSSVLVIEDKSSNLFSLVVPVAFFYWLSRTLLSSYLIEVIEYWTQAQAAKMITPVSIVFIWYYVPHTSLVTLIIPSTSPSPSPSPRLQYVLVLCLLPNFPFVCTHTYVLMYCSPSYIWEHRQ